MNKLKDRMLGYEFIQQCHGQVVQVSLGKPVKIFEVEEYERFVKEHYARNGVKMRKLLMADIPDQFIERQLNDSRYISRSSNPCCRISCVRRANKRQFPRT